MTEVIDKTPPRASAQKIPAAEEVTNIEVTPSEIAATEATSTEDLNLETTIEHIHKILLNMATEEATTPVIFHSPPGVLLTFPSQYWYAIGRSRVSVSYTHLSKKA